jgi:hypothetical protein
MARHERLIHVKIASKSASAIISNPNGNSRLKMMVFILTDKHDAAYVSINFPMIFGCQLCDRQNF